jgi:hypothetical protein
MVVNAHEAEQQQYAAATAIHINTLRILISSLLPLAAKNARNPKLWMEELEQLAIMSADYAKFEAAGAVNPELERAVSCLRRAKQTIHASISDVQGSR